MKQITIDQITQYHHVHTDGRTVPMEQVQVNMVGVAEPLVGFKCPEDITLVLMKVMKTTVSEKDVPIGPPPGEPSRPS